MKLKNFCTTKEMVTKLKRPPTGENLCQLYIWQGTDNQNIQGIQKTKLPQKSMTPWRNRQMNWTEPLKEEVQMAKEHMKKLLYISDHKGSVNQNHSKITSVRIATIKNTNNSKYWWGGGVWKESFIHCWWKCKLAQPQWKAVQRPLKKLKIDLP
jgi:hypothetical protein